MLPFMWNDTRPNCSWSTRTGHLREDSVAGKTDSRKPLLSPGVTVKEQEKDLHGEDQIVMQVKDKKNFHSTNSKQQYQKGI
jgi:hypothetical protein